MRITREVLLKLTQEKIEQKIKNDRGILSVYLCGSFLGQDFMLGGAADIDLVIIHLDKSAGTREILPLTDDIHLDISYDLPKNYRQPRNLRVHPWLGPTIYSCQILHDPQHLMNYVQAGVRGQFNIPEHTYERARSGYDHARQIWQSLAIIDQPAGIEQISSYLKSIVHAANAIASLNGNFLTERRLMVQFAREAEEIGRPGLYQGLIGLLGGHRTSIEQMQDWIKPWEEAYLAVPEEGRHPRMHPKRCSYYRRAFEHYLTSETPKDILWPLLNTWTTAAGYSETGSAVFEGWKRAITELGFLGDKFSEKTEALDAYLDSVEETLESWASHNGIANL